MTEYERWLSVELDDPDLKEELLSVKDQPEEINDRFYRDLAFGTGGLRGVIGAGTNRMNVYTVRKATQGLANYLNKHNTEGKPISVAIAHDSTYSTLYAHMSAVAVSEGQWVNKGDVIGYVGDTGYSFGDHCHFEVYQNGTRVDPSQFV